VVSLVGLALVVRLVAGQYVDVLVIVMVGVGVAAISIYVMWDVYEDV
jgi:hypothetical protein